MESFVESLNRFVWGAPTLVLILGLGIWLSVRTRFAQIRLLPRALRLFFSQLRRDKSEDGISPLRALCTALAATVGTGNIAGVAGAIAIGGPGAIFWMWVCGVLGMMVKFAEATICVRYRTDAGGEYLAGPMYAVREALDQKWQFLAGIYAFFGVIAAFGVGNATQINAVITAAEQAMGLRFTRAQALAVAAPLAVLVGVSLFGGADRIGAAAQKLVMFGAALYLLLGGYVLIARMNQIPHALCAIVRGAFDPKAVTGGTVGAVMTTLRIGVSRGVFTNEAGLGTAGIAHGGAGCVHPVRQGMLGIVEVFIDTIVICTVTALVILVSGAPVPYGSDPGAALTGAAFSAVCGSWAGSLLALTLSVFALATVLGWGLYGARCAQFLFGRKAFSLFSWLQVAAVILSAVLQTETVWLLSETVNGLMAIPNLIILAKLSPEVLRLTDEYGAMRANGGTYENFYQCKPMRTVSYAKISPSGGKSGKRGKEDLSPEHRSAGSGYTAGIL